MQSDPRVGAALSALAPQIAAYRYSISATLDRAKTTLASESGKTWMGTALGAFAAGRIDPARFAMISAGSPPLDVVDRAVAERAVEVLDSILHAGDEEFFVDVQPGTSATAAIRARMTTLGSAFGAGALLELVRRRTYDPVQHGLSFAGYPFERWTTAERRIAPPLVVRLEGSDLDPFELAPLLDGCVRLVLLVNEPCAPAPLARLISPTVFVAQTGEMKLLETLAGLESPAVIGMMKGSEARFVHDPRRGVSMWQRVEVTRMPDVSPRKALGARSAFQQREDLALLKGFAEQPVLPLNPTDALVAAIGPGNVDSVERLTAWVLDQSAVPGSS